MPVPPETADPAPEQPRKPRRPPRTADEKAALQTAMDDVCGQLRRRALVLKRCAIFAFVVTVVLLGAGGWFIWNADDYALAQSKEQSAALATQRAAADEQDKRVKELEKQFLAAKSALADQIALGWPPRRVGQSLYGSTMAPDGRRGWAVGEGGTILRTENAGASWQTQTAGTTEDFRSVQMASDGLRGWAVGSGGTILRTGNAGASWQTQTAGTTNNLWSIQMAS
ncbi:MAG: hypothetical protein EXR07_03365, partial [Acetobacteraceae bacterium]|nr:hypothetical protein [Acetobacteraceae bacterium]